MLPAGIQPPIVVQYNASSVPVLQLSLASDRLSEQQLYDYGLYNLRQQLAPVQGVTFPAPDGGKYRQIMVDIDPLKLQAEGLMPADVVNAVSAQNSTLPSGLAKIGDTQCTVRTNAMPVSIGDFNTIPIKYTNGQTVFLKDVGQVHDGWAVQQNVVHQDGRRSVLLSVLKNGSGEGTRPAIALVDKQKALDWENFSHPAFERPRALNRGLVSSSSSSSFCPPPIARPGGHLMIGPS